MMKWSRELPKVDGWYWMQDLDTEATWPVEIRDGQLYENDLLIDWPLVESFQYQPIRPPEDYS
jgi:hypothetical protein